MLNLNAIRQRSPLFTIAVIFVLIGLILLSVFSARDKKSPTPLESPNPSALSPEVIIPPKEKTVQENKDIKPIRDKIIASELSNQNGDIVLFESQDFRIVYVPTPDIFFVMVNQNPIESRVLAQKWFLDFELKQQDLCTLPVRFILNFELKQQNPNFNILPDGC
ncbi:MAG: hypothetical protein NUV69_03430 [Candidatus Curtissbacteria bacterium]|nr:hypothetical protein [Candidatus Curtissbacteria bacterium]